jgi:GNAT superfamily N-acetyltransferase
MEKMASRIHAVQTAAYRQEAALLGIREFPPLNRTVRDVMASSDSFFGAFDGEVLVGVMSLEQRNENEVSISSLTVTPQFQRLGVARALVASIATWTRSQKFSVFTATKNAPALALYKQLGFVECSRRLVGVEQIEVVELEAERSNSFFSQCAGRLSAPVGNPRRHIAEHFRVLRIRE